MEWTSLNDLREKYLSFFESKGHLRLGSYSLVPNNDKSLLLINSGMAPMKKFFTGEVTPPRNRVTTCQKCIRTPDLERVGHTARHGTYFEMLGNFSFGDYFKDQAIEWAWEFLTETLEIPKDLLWPSVYEEDDEAYAIWRDKIGVCEEHIVKLGKADNFWEHGTGPCGPCSEIYFDRGEKYGCGSPDCKPGCDCDRYMEIWNNVFSQFNNMGDGTYTELEHKNIDTGMGLERLACVMQGVDNMFEVDTVRNILNKVCEISGKEYGKDSKIDISIRAITDHARASTFMISDGILPSNEGRGYVLRRLIRRACRHGKLIGINRDFLVELIEAVINENKSGYPELIEKQEFIKKVITNEETAFAKTIDQGLSILEGLMGNGGQLSGDDAFKLYDTYGFPLDLTKDILAEQGMTLDEDRFNELMIEQRERARNSRKAGDAESWKSDGIVLEGVEATEFVGYTEFSCDANVLAVVAEGEQAGTIESGAKGIIVLNKTSFYAESGGQVGDKGVIVSDKAKFVVEDTKKSHDGIFYHTGYVESGSFSVNDSVKAEIDGVRRRSISRNHSSLHLLQAALRTVLGTHVEQAGSYVDELRGRLDFTHFSALTSEEISKVEALVNEQILNSIAVDVNLMSLEEAKKTGAMALFGEKYGEVVRVVAIGDFSKEFCGGAHVENTGNIGLFKIVSESSVAAGVRRIECVTGINILAMLNDKENIINQIAEAVKSNVNDVVKKAAILTEDLKACQKEVESLNSKLAMSQISDIVNNAVEVNGVKVAVAILNIQPDALRGVGENIKDKYSDMITVLAIKGEDKINFMCVCGKEAVAKGAHAGNIVKKLAELTGGKGGGRPDSAMAGGKDVAALESALNCVADIAKDLIK